MGEVVHFYIYISLATKPHKGEEMLPRRVAIKCEHGGASVSGDIFDFSANLNPYGPPPFSSSAIEDAMKDLGIYPDSDATALRERIAEKLKRDTDEIIVSAGISELIYLIFIAFSPEKVVIPQHTYCEYERAARIFGVRVEKIRMPALKIRAEEIIHVMRNRDIIFLCNPNNPTGQYLSGDEMKMLIEAAEERDALLVVDEAYVDFAMNAAHLHTVQSHNLLLLRSFTKSYGVPGVRIGFAIGTEDVIGELNAVKPPWNVDVFAQKIGIASLMNEDFLHESLRKVWQQKRRMEDELDVRSDANFFLFDTSRCDMRARDVKKALLSHGILVRDCTSFGLPFHIRFCVRRENENDRLISALLGLMNHE